MPLNFISITIITSIYIHMDACLAFKFKTKKSNSQKECIVSKKFGKQCINQSPLSKNSNTQVLCTILGGKIEKLT